MARTGAYGKLNALVRWLRAMDDLEDGTHRDTRLTLGKRGQRIKAQPIPRRYSWLRNSAGVIYLHRHKAGESPPGSFSRSPFVTRFYAGR